MSKKSNVQEVIVETVTEQPKTEIVDQVVTVTAEPELTFTTKSAAIRYHHSQGKTTGQIAKLMGIRYQHVRNVLITPVTKPTK